ncbi:MAG: asparagine synthase (glutamine-hydrolyzing) [Chitinophagales bacterium]|nr:asparagine synthase (glutamine-hydrolyzing) [Chitinophagales bacterium]
MCAIAGVFHGEDFVWGGKELAPVITCMAHRGPDGIFIKELKRITLAHARLVITDPSEKANQPFFDETGRFALVFNGAIYNYQELRSNLIKKGKRFITTSDTEVFVQLFAEYGTACFGMMEGMFAAAIWDSLTQKLVLVRDRFGEKPLYYRKSNGRFYFASESEALTKVDKMPEINLAGLNHLLAIGYILNPDSIYKDVYSLAPACYIEIAEATQTINQVYYWDYKSFFENKTAASDNDIIEQFGYLLRNATAKCVKTNVPTGMFLSGGVDSASVLALAVNANVRLKAYTVFFEAAKYSEHEKAKRNAKYMGTEHVLAMFAEDEIKNRANEFINLLPCPISDNSFLALYKLALLAKKDCRVIITGDGADELMAGYSTAKANKIYPAFSALPTFIKKFLSVHAVLPDSKQALSAGFIQKQFFAGCLYNYRQAHYSWRLLHNPEQRVTLLGLKNKELVYDTDPFKKFDKIFSECAHLEKNDQFLIVDAQTWLTDNILIKTDRALMLNGLEARTPFLNHTLAEFLATLPFKWKLKGFNEKYILRTLMKNYLPEEILNTPKKGFNLPDFLQHPAQNQFRYYNEWFVKNYKQGLLSSCLNIAHV